MTEKSVVINEDQYAWEFDESQGNRSDAIRWKNMISGDKTPTRGMSMGILEVPSGAIMDIHHHHPQEIYYVTQGEAELYLDDRWQPIRKGDAVYVPADIVHAIRNKGKDLFKLVWVFPTDTWSEIEYYDD